MKKAFRYPSSSSVRRKQKTPCSPLPAHFTPYSEDMVASVQRRSISPKTRRLETSLQKGKKSQKKFLCSPKNLRGISPCVLFSPPQSESRLTTEIIPNDFENQYLDCKMKLSALQQAYSDVSQQNQTLQASLHKSTSGSISCSSVCSPPPLLSPDTRLLSTEVEEMYGHLSSSHHTIQELQSRHQLLANDVYKVQVELRVLRYQNELKKATTEVKSTLVSPRQLDEVLQKRREDLQSLKVSLKSARRDKSGLEEAITATQHEHSMLKVSVKALQMKSSSDLISLSEASEQLCIITAKLEESEAKVRSLEEAIKCRSRQQS